MSSSTPVLSLADIRLTDAADFVQTSPGYLPRGRVLEFFAASEPEVLVSGPAGTGKSRGILELIHFLLRRYARSRALIVRKTRASLNESGLFTYEEQVLTPRERAVLVGERSRETRQKYSYPNGSELVAGGLDKPTRLFSTEYDLIYVQEAQETTLDDWESFMRALRNGKMPYQQLVGDCNPDRPTHYLKRRADEGGLRMIRSLHTDNPRLYTDDGELTEYGRDYIGKLKRLTGARRKRLLLGQWAGAEGMVYEPWDDGVHVVEPFPVPRDWRRIRVVDFGYTNPFTCQWWAISPDGVAYLYRETYRTKTLVRDHAEEIKRLSVHPDGTPERIECTIADHDAEGRATLKEHGITTIPADKQIERGVEDVNARLRFDPESPDRSERTPRLYLMQGALAHSPDPALLEAMKPTCLEQEAPGYVWPTGASGKPEKEAPVKVDDHGCDAMRYLCRYLNTPRRRRTTALI